MEQSNLFEYLFQDFKFKKPIRLIELFAGYGSQAMSLKKLQEEGLLKFEHHKVVEFDKYAIKSYNAIHYTNFETIDIRDIHYQDLEIEEYMFSHYPVFETEEECREYKRYLDLLDECTFKPNWKDRDEHKYYLYYDNDIKEITIGWCDTMRVAVCYFESKEKAQKFIEKVGEENIKKFMFDIWED